MVGFQEVSQPKPKPKPKPSTTHSWPWNPFANSPKETKPKPKTTWTPPKTDDSRPSPKATERNTNTTPTRQLPTRLRVSKPAVDYMKSWERPPKVNGRISGAVFRDTKGGKTIGYGHFIKAEEEPRWAAYDPELGGSMELSLSQMEDLFREDVDRLAEADIRKRIRVPLRQHEYDALVDFVFHRGAGALRQSGLESYINTVSNGVFDYNKITDCFMVYAFWFNRNTNSWEYVEGFAKRRREEIDMFRYGRYTLHA